MSLIFAYASYNFWLSGRRTLGLGGFNYLFNAISFLSSSLSNSSNAFFLASNFFSSAFSSSSFFFSSAASSTSSPLSATIAA